MKANIAKAMHKVIFGRDYRSELGKVGEHKKRQAAVEDLAKGLSKNLPTEILWEKYDRASTILSHRNPEAVESTPAERIFKALIKKETSRGFLEHAWIGAVNVDFLFLQLGGKIRGERNKLSKGLAIEIDGAVHHEQGKVLKDQYKDTYLASLGIALMRIPNEKVTTPWAVTLAQGIARLPRLGTREIRALRRTIATQTLLMNPGLLCQRLPSSHEKFAKETPQCNITPSKASNKRLVH